MCVWCTLSEPTQPRSPAATDGKHLFFWLEGGPSQLFFLLGQLFEQKFEENTSSRPFFLRKPHRKRAPPGPRRLARIWAQLVWQRPPTKRVRQAALPSKTTTLFSCLFLVLPCVLQVVLFPTSSCRQQRQQRETEKRPKSPEEPAQPAFASLGTARPLDFVAFTVLSSVFTISTHSSQSFSPNSLLRQPCSGLE